jgi:hypothetical protein
VDEQGINRGLRRNENGQVMTTSLSAEGERQLTQIAEITGGNVVRSEAGSTGIEEVARRLRAMMTEELSERVETVYADVYAYPLGLALLCILLEAFVPEVWRRRSRRTAPSPTAAKLAAPAGGSERAAATASVLVLLLVCGAFSALGSGCDSQVVDRAFTRRAPDVDRGIEALEARDAGAAARYFTGYLGTGSCKDGAIGAPPTLAERPQASLDLGLALFQIAERFGGRFGEDQGRAEDNPQQLAARSAEVACALSVLEQIVGRRKLPLELTAQAHYLLGNLEFLRREYKAAVSHYNRALELIPGDDAESAQAVGRDAAHNRALALRRAEEDKPKPPQHPDAGPEPGDAGAPQDQPPEHGDAGRPSPKGDQNQDQKNQDQNQDQQQPPKDQESKSSDQQDQQQDQQQQDQQGKNQPAPQQAPEGQEPKQTPPPEQHAMSLSQDDKALDQLERAPTVQQEAARAQRGRMRRVVEDK